MKKTEKHTRKIGQLIDFQFECWSSETKVMTGGLRMNPLMTRKPKTGTLANSEDPVEM